MGNSKFLDQVTSGKTCVIVGTRPGIIKMSPLISELEERSAESFVIHAGQHYSHNLDEKMFEDLNLSPPDYHLDDIKNKKLHGEQTAAMLEGIEKALVEEKPGNVLVCGDANFNLAGALAARKLRLTLGHVEAGLRSGDWRMPEEHNRVMIDHISDYLFAPTEQAKQNAIQDNVQGEVIVTGNTIVDAVRRNIELAKNNSEILTELNLLEDRYVVFTAHREENVDDKRNLNKIIRTIELISEKFDLKIVYPIHPRTKKRLEQFELLERTQNIDKLSLIEPLGYLDFLRLLDSAEVTLTDSGGIQEEACILGIPCITLRDNTERPETVEVGSNVVAGVEPDSVIPELYSALDNEDNWIQPFGEGSPAENILNAIY